ncbi:hypothetical protein EPA93_22325 [Ktedonosporobacter rubrisoli]|uniref:Uncharacterized protein n=1 Tax=Ktedonosporobacter rubrisoli TaxID=2509675 RepID=A0A4P6JTG0_KTERU|nr:hypothetical protein [Ktedonosporobacter rubrisoli]QBD78580.1 hypothetical protein EPA93_22325 [Ktedonosporobacter rubrisoli]
MAQKEVGETAPDNLIELVVSAKLRRAHANGMGFERSHEKRSPYGEARRKEKRQIRSGRI